MANGFLGQYVLVEPATHLVVVRMYAGPADEKEDPPEGSGFEKMVPLSSALVHPPDAKGAKGSVTPAAARAK